MKISSTLGFASLLFPICAFAQTLGDTECDVSKRLSVSLTTMQSGDEACEKIDEPTTEICGDKYIFPILSGHPDAELQWKINKYIAGLSPQNDSDQIHNDAWTEIQFNKYNLLSLSHKSQSYGARSSESVPRANCTNIELDTGRILTIEDVLKANYTTSLPSIILKNLDSGLKKNVPEYVRNAVSKMGGDWRIEPDQMFYVNDHALVLCLNGSSLQTGSLGAVELGLPYPMVQSLIDKNGPLSFASGVSVAKTEIEQLSTQITDVTMPDLTPNPISQPKEEDEIIDEPAPEFSDSNGYYSYACTKETSIHLISAIENEAGSQHVCQVDYTKNGKNTVLWRSFTNKEFCTQKARDLVRKYENVWNWTCSPQ